MHLNPPNRRRLLKPGTDKSSLLSKEVLNIVFGQAHTHTHNPLTVRSLSSKYKITFGNSWLLSSQHEHKATKKENYPGTHSYISRSGYIIILGHIRTLPEAVKKLSSDTLVHFQKRLENYPGTHLSPPEAVRKLSWDTLVHFQKWLENYPGTYSYISRSCLKIILGHTRTLPNAV